MKEILDMIRSIRSQRMELELKEKQLILSIKMDNISVDCVLRYFFNVKKITDFENYEQKKMFVFVCASLICPMSIAGDRLSPKTRGSISIATGLRPTRISDILSEVRISYKTYKDFKQEADYLYNSIKRSLTS